MAVVDIDAPQLETAAADLEGALLIHGDVSDEGSVAAFTDAIAARFGRLFTREVDDTVYAEPLIVPGVVIAGARRTLLLVDARSPERYRGEVEPLDPVAGHIPGALNRPFQANLDAGGTFKSPAVLRAEFDALLAGTSSDLVVHLCGSGVTACHNLLAMEVAGLHGTRLYPGSWSEWCADPARPMTKGNAP